MIPYAKIRKNALLIAILIIALFARTVYFDLNPHSVACAHTNLAVGFGTIALNLLDGKFFTMDGYNQQTNQINAVVTAHQKFFDFQQWQFSKSTDSISKPSLYHHPPNMPGYAAILAITWWVTGIKIFAWIQMLQIFLDVFVVYIVYYCGVYLFNKRVGLLAALGYALFLPIFCIVNAPFRDAWPIFFSAFVAALLIKISKHNFDSKKRMKYYFLIGIILGLGLWVRETLFALAPFIGFAIFVKYGWKEAIKATLIFIFMVLLLLTPWIIDGYKVYNEFVLITAGGGHGLYTGFGEYPNKYGTTFNDTATRLAAEKINPDVQFLSSEYDKILKGKAIRIISDNPIYYGQIVLHRVYRGMFFDNPGIWKRGTAPNLNNFGEYGQRLNVILIIFVLATIFGVLLSLKRIKETIFILIIPMYFILLYAPLQMQSRFVLPMAWTYFVFAAFALIWILKKLSIIKTE